eukprot:scaffold2098_cov228-Ochromonas_danica.AAC.2
MGIYSAGCSHSSLKRSYLVVPNIEVVLWYRREKLPGDILHSVYSEWLGWKDVSRLDVACVGKSDREVWLTSLTDLRIFNALGINRVSDDFPVSVNVLEDLMVGGLDMESYCPALRSIVIRRRRDVEINPDVDEVKDNLSDFLRVLLEKLRENSLIKLLLSLSLEAHDSQVMSETLLIKHASSLQQLYLDITDGMKMGIIASTLIKNDVHLRVLDVYIVDDFSQTTASLISYLSSAGDLLESLKVRLSRSWGSYNIDDLMVSVATSCSKLTRVYIYDVTCGMEKVRLLYEQCPHLQDAVIDEAIDTNSTNWAICLSYALRRRQYKKVILRLREDYYHPVENLKSLLEPYEICLETSAPEATLILLLQDLPHLNSLCMRYYIVDLYTYATLAAITQHAAKSLNELRVACRRMEVNGLSHFDQVVVSELIKKCELLTSLRISGCGWESLVAVSKHSSMRRVDFRTFNEVVSEEMLDGLLLDEKVQWPSTLEEGTVESGAQRCVFPWETTLGVDMKWKDWVVL